MRRVLEVAITGAHTLGDALTKIDSLLVAGIIAQDKLELIVGILELGEVIIDGGAAEALLDFQTLNLMLILGVFGEDRLSNDLGRAVALLLNHLGEGLTVGMALAGHFIGQGSSGLIFLVEEEVLGLAVEGLKLALLALLLQREIGLVLAEVKLGIIVEADNFVVILGRLGKRGGRTAHQLARPKEAGLGVVVQALVL